MSAYPVSYSSEEDEIVSDSDAATQPETTALPLSSTSTDPLQYGAQDGRRDEENVERSNSSPPYIRRRDSTGSSSDGVSQSMHNRRSDHAAQRLRSQGRTVTRSDLALFYSLVDETPQEKEAITALREHETAVDAAIRYRKPLDPDKSPAVEEAKLHVSALISDLEQVNSPARNQLPDAALAKLLKPLKGLSLAFRDARNKEEGDLTFPALKGDYGVAVPRRIYYLAKLVKQDWWDFSHHISSQTWDPCIEYLVEQPRANEVEVKFRRAATVGPVVNQPQQQEASQNVGMQLQSDAALREMPERLRIRSTAVVRILVDLLEGELQAPENVMYPMDFIRPFKALIYAETAIRQRFATLRALMDEKEAYMETCHKRFLEENAHIKPVFDEDEHNPSLDLKTGRMNAEVIDPDALSPPVRRAVFHEAGPCPYFDSEMFTESCDLRALTYTDLAEAFNEFAILIQFIDEHITPRRNYVKGSSIVIDELKKMELLKARGDVQTSNGEEVDSNLLGEYAVSSVAAKKKGGAKPKQYYFSDLWHMFEPGTLVYRKTEPRHKVWQVLHCTGGRRLRETQDQLLSQLIIDCHYIDHNGSGWLRFERRFSITGWTGMLSAEVMELQTLDNAIEQGLTTRESQMSSGLEFRSCVLGERHRVFRGKTIDRNVHGHSLHVTGRGQVFAKTMNGQVIVDFERCLQINPQWQELGDSFTGESLSDGETWDAHKLIEDDRKWDARMMNDFVEPLDAKMTEWNRGSAKPDGTDLLLLVDRVFAFVLRDRQWACLQCTGNAFEAVPPRHQAWNELMIPPGHKDIVQSLVEARFDAEDRTPNDYDLIRDKGKGLIVLLHGAPGVGKTSTAECVAEYYNKPLLPITCGDLGLTAEQVEATLQESFQLAQAWDCVLLLDEADVFLATRTVEDIQRNALVSVFLRVLEYYNGILFLTTNRVGTFDEAFKSRIHMSLHYDNLNWDQTEAIWKSQIRRASGHTPPVECDEKSLLAFAKALYEKQKDDALSNGPVWNGRQIRNAFQSAIAMAKRDTLQMMSQNAPDSKFKLSKVLVKDYHFHKVAGVAKDFNSYMTDLRRGKGDEWWARQNMHRIDNYRQGPSQASAYPRPDDRLPASNPYGSTFQSSQASQQYALQQTHDRTQQQYSHYGGQYGRNQFTAQARPVHDQRDHGHSYNSLQAPRNPQQDFDQRHSVQSQDTLNGAPPMTMSEVRQGPSHAGQPPPFGYIPDATGGAPLPHTYNQH